MAEIGGLTDFDFDPKIKDSILYQSGSRGESSGLGREKVLSRKDTRLSSESKAQLSEKVCNLHDSTQAWKGVTREKVQKLVSNCPGIG